VIKEIWTIVCGGRSFDKNDENDEFFQTKHTFRLEKYKDKIECDIFKNYYKVKENLMSLMKELNVLEDRINDKYPLMLCAGISPKGSFRYGMTPEQVDEENEKILKELIFYINSKKS